MTGKREDTPSGPVMPFVLPDDVEVPVPDPVPPVMPFVLTDDTPADKPADKPATKAAPSKRG